jgi:hypothetical protein
VKDVVDQARHRQSPRLTAVENFVPGRRDDVKLIKQPVDPIEFLEVGYRLAKSALRQKPSFDN